MEESQAQAPTRTPEFLAVGHVTKDILPGGGYALGGTVSYAALTVARLGCASAVYTRASGDLMLTEALRGVDVHAVLSPCATTFENIYHEDRRQQYVHRVADRLRVEQLPASWRDVPTVLLAPVVHELGLEWLEVFPDALLGATPQGWLRAWDRNGRVRFRRWPKAQQVFSRVDVLIFSEEDVAGDEGLVRHFAGMAKMAVVTRGRRGATLFRAGSTHDFAPFPANEVDPTGAGDVFAAALLVRLHETGDPRAAMVFANCAASLSVEGSGTGALPDRQQVEERLRRVKLAD
jgi:sugar/nucleoside kinase (ribokinase family)